ncbi:hypothetical protein O7630_10185 [Micromonospora sp. WMMD718]|uniref:DUF6884 domain-containing protein n=1 Tax=Micromonospora TaxID=1873 RepID=UPI00069E63FE|nr:MULTISPECIES: DUF6884 domain-containing protein [unclassified Micromonospora]MDG4751309.1 hypothetical protein [Micromonospora sp. WMMD718]
MNLRRPRLANPAKAIAHTVSEAHSQAELVIVGCSAEKTPTLRPLPALDLYDGGCVPHLRARVGHLPHQRSRVRFLSAEHGLVTADTRLHTYDRPLDPARAAELRPRVWAQLQADLHSDHIPDDILVVAEPLYLVLLADLLADSHRPRIHWIADHADGWPQAAAILDVWGW